MVQVFAKYQKRHLKIFQSDDNRDKDILTVKHIPVTTTAIDQGFFNGYAIVSYFWITEMEDDPS